MSSTNITQGNITKRIDEKQSADQNSTEEQATSSSIKTQNNVKLTPLTKKFEKPTIRSNSLSSLDELSKLNKDVKGRAISIKMDSMVDEYNLTINENTKSLNDISEILKTKEDATCAIKTHISIDTDDVYQEEIACTNAPNIYPSNTGPNIIIVTNDFASRPPPSYQYSQRPQSFMYQGMEGQTPVYQTQNMGYQIGMAQDPSQPPPYRQGNIDIETENLFNTREIRNKFVRKVYLILAIQLLFTFGFISLCIYEKNTREFVKRQRLLMIQSMIGLFCLMIVLFCYTQARRTYPFNFILLSLLTLCMSYLMAAVSCYYDTKIVMISMGATGGICTLISILAWQHWFDITNYGMLIYIALFIVMMYGLCASILALITGSNISFLIFACLITLVFCVYLMYDTQKILGGRRIEISPEEYILGAITLYVDVMIIFHYILVLATHCR